MLVFYVARVSVLSVLDILFNHMILNVGGASGRAGPRVIVLDGSSSGNASYRFYPTSSDDIGDDDEVLY